jgi:hypothetical protein
VQGCVTPSRPQHARHVLCVPAAAAVCAHSADRKPVRVTDAASRGVLKNVSRETAQALVMSGGSVGSQHPRLLYGAARQLILSRCVSRETLRGMTGAAMGCRPSVYASEVTRYAPFAGTKLVSIRGLRPLLGLRGAPVWAVGCATAAGTRVDVGRWWSRYVAYGRYSTGGHTDSGGGAILSCRYELSRRLAAIRYAACGRYSTGGVAGQ